MNSEVPLKDLNELVQKLEMFQENSSLLKQALAHRSYAHEIGVESNERLEFLGDSVLSLVISEYIYKHFPKKSEGDLSKWRAYFVNADSLAKIAKKIDLGNYLLLGVGEERSGGRERKSLLADAMEALIAAIYLEYGWERVSGFIIKLWEPLIEQMKKHPQPIDPKTILQEVLQSKGSSPKYKLVNVKGPDHNRSYSVAVYNDDQLIGTGRGKSKKEAEQEAAEEALKIIE
jgi:ribonuclease-3